MDFVMFHNCDFGQKNSYYGLFFMQLLKLLWKNVDYGMDMESKIFHNYFYNSIHNCITIVFIILYILNNKLHNYYHNNKEPK